MQTCILLQIVFYYNSTCFIDGVLMSTNIICVRGMYLRKEVCISLSKSFLFLPVSPVKILEINLHSGRTPSKPYLEAQFKISLLTVHKHYSFVE